MSTMNAEYFDLSRYQILVIFIFRANFPKKDTSSWKQKKVNFTIEFSTSTNNSDFLDQIYPKKCISN